MMKGVEQCESTVTLDPIPAVRFTWSTLFHRVGKDGTHIFHKKSMENLWNRFNNILWTKDDSATIGRIEISGDPDSAIGRKKPNKKSPGAKRPVG